MAENEENKINTEELKSEASNTVNQVKDTIKKVDIKKDSVETKGFVVEMFKNPLEKIKDVAEDTKGKYLKYAIIVFVISMFLSMLYYLWIGRSILSLLTFISMIITLLDYFT